MDKVYETLCVLEPLLNSVMLDVNLQSHAFREESKQSEVDRASWDSANFVELVYFLPWHVSIAVKGSCQIWE